jgi:hypothetical protein
VSGWDSSGTTTSDDGSDKNPEWIGLYSNPSRPRARTIMDTDSTGAPLADHPAVLTFRNDGVSTEDLVSFVESFASLRSNRISGVGAREYSGRGNQKV